MARPHFRKARNRELLWGSILIVAASQTACAPARSPASDPNKLSSIRLQFQRVDGSRYQQSSLSNAAGTPFELSTDYCYAVHVTGDHPSLRRLPPPASECVEGPQGLGLFKGFASKGDTLEISVPIGAHRVFDLLSVPKSALPGGNCAAAQAQVDPQPGLPDSSDNVQITINGEVRQEIGDQIGWIARGISDIAPGDTEITLVAVSTEPGGKDYDCESSSKSAPPTTSGNLLSLSVEPFNAAATQWNDWAKQSDGSPCQLSMANYSDCRHAGERRRVNVSSLQHCAGLYMEDALQVFDWRCRQGSDSAIYFSSELRRENRGLRDLIAIQDATTPVWKQNKVTLYKDGNPIGSSLDAVWWNNPLQVLPESQGTAPLVLSEAGKIYVLPADRPSSYGYNLNADRIGLVSLKTTANGEPARLGLASGAGYSCNAQGEVGNTERCFVATGSQKNLWIELSLSSSLSTSRASSGGGTQGLTLFRTVFSRVHQTQISGFSRGLTISNADTNGLPSQGGLLLSQLTLVHNGEAGLYLDSSNNNTMYSVGAFNNGETNGYTDAGIKLVNSSSNAMSRINASNNSQAGLRIESEDASHASSLNNLTQFTLNNNKTMGLYVTSNTPLNLPSSFINGVAMGNENYGIKFFNINQAELTNVASLSNQTGLFVSNSALSAFGTMILGANSSSCASSSGTVTHLDLTNCVVATGSGSALELRKPASLSSPFVGKTGTAMSYQSGLNWTHLSRLQVGIGRQGTPAFPEPSQLAGPCLSGQCIVYDWRLKESDGVLLNRTQMNLSAGATNAAFPLTGGPCPSTFTETASIQGKTVFKLATEDPMAPQNNRNGYCEVGERCFYTPNFGVYQGGRVSDVFLRSCQITSGNTNTEFLGYGSNGIP